MSIYTNIAQRASRDPEFLAQVVAALSEDAQKTRDLLDSTRTAVGDVIATLEVASTDDVDGDGYHGHCLSGTTLLRLRNIRDALESQAQEVAA